MARPKKTAAPAQAAAAGAPALDMGVLKLVVEATRGPGFMYYDADALAPLAAAGYVEVRTDMADPPGSNNLACRASPAGMEAFDAFAAAPPPAAVPASPFAVPPVVAPPAAPPAPVVAVAPPAAAPVQTPSQFKILTGIPIPAAREFGKAAVYPFDSLAVGACFPVPATQDRPNPMKSLASTVNSASKRNGGVKHFLVRNVPDGKDYGYPGVRCAVVWRDK